MSPESQIARGKRPWVCITHSGFFPLNIGSYTGIRKGAGILQGIGSRCVFSGGSKFGKIGPLSLTAQLSPRRARTLPSRGGTIVLEQSLAIAASKVSWEVYHLNGLAGWVFGESSSGRNPDVSESSKELMNTGIMRIETARKRSILG